MNGKVILLGLASILAACAQKPVVESAAFFPGLPSAPATYKLVDNSATDLATARAIIETRLKDLGFNPADNPDIIITVAASERANATGAYSPNCEGDPAWIAKSTKKKLVGGGQIIQLSVSMSDARSGALLYQSKVTSRGKPGSMISSAQKLANVALSSNPRDLPLSSLPVCPAS